MDDGCPSFCPVLLLRLEPPRTPFPTYPMLTKASTSSPEFTAFQELYKIMTSSRYRSGLGPAVLLVWGHGSLLPLAIAGQPRVAAAHSLVCPAVRSAETNPDCNCARAQGILAYPWPGPACAVSQNKAGSKTAAKAKAKSKNSI